MKNSINWDIIKLVAFDVDGTLYGQTKLRLLMAREMAIYSILNADPLLWRVIRHYRNIRERLADEETENFEIKLLEETATKTGLSKTKVNAIIEEWLKIRPLPYLFECRYEYISEIFYELRQQGKVIGVLSDYPAIDKLRALKLEADIIITANDIGILKPHPRGLEKLMAISGIPPENTLLIGDRVERDGYAAQRAGTHVLIKSKKELNGWNVFNNYKDIGIFPFLNIFK